MPSTPVHLVPVWRTAPFIRLVVPMMVGIIIARYLQSVWVNWPWFILFSGAGVLFAHFIAINRPVYFGLAVFLFWLCAGASLYRLGREEYGNNFIGTIYRPGSLVLATLVTQPEPKGANLRAEAKLRQWDSVSASWQPLEGKIYVTFSGDSAIGKMVAGSEIAFKKNLQPIRNSGNPGAFNYKAYAADKGIYFRVFLQQKDYISGITEKGNILTGWPFRARDALLNTLRQYIPDSKALGVAEALLTGYRNDMDDDLQTIYAGTGVAHIIAISGMHLGLIMKALEWLLMPLARRGFGRKLVPFFIMLFLWLFALITGAGPSVLRSALMFSIFLFGKVIGRQGNAYNSLAASAFLLLLYNPNLLFDVGFQLSYSAMLSIFIFYLPLRELKQWNNRWMQNAWSLVAVTLAAQVLTLPFVVYYFQQFPVYFLLANLVAVPLSTLALYGTLILTMIVGWVPVLATFTGWLTTIIIRCMNGFIAWVYRLPFSRIEQVYFDLPQAILLMVVVGLIGCWLIWQNRKCVVGALAGLLLLFIQREYAWQHSGLQQKLIIYNIRGYSAIDIIKGHQATFWGAKEIIRDPLIFRFNILPARTMHHITDTMVLPIMDSGFTILQVGGKKLLILDKEPALLKSGIIETDWLLVDANIRAKPARVLEKISCSEIIIGSKLPAYRIGAWQSAADSLHLRLHPMAEKGAYVYDFKSP